MDTPKVYFFLIVVIYEKNSIINFIFFQFQKLFYAGPVTSLCFHNDIILLSGQGPYFKVFYVPTGNLLYSQPIMEYWRIYRIVPGNPKHNRWVCSYFND